MQKNNKAEKAKASKPVNKSSKRKPECRAVRGVAVGKPSKPARQAKRIESRRARKPLTAEQRKRKNERYRARRAAAKAAKYASNGQPGVKDCDEARVEKHSAGCGGTGNCLCCERRGRCEHLANPARVPKLYAVTLEEQIRNDRNRIWDCRKTNRVASQAAGFVTDAIGEMVGMSCAYACRSFSLPRGGSVRVEVTYARGGCGDASSGSSCGGDVREIVERNSRLGRTWEGDFR